MNTSPFTAQSLAASVVAVPPLARKADLTIDRQQNDRIIRHLQSGGITTLLYGGNANFYHVPLSEYGSLLQVLAELAGDDTCVIPAVGPAYGTMMDQARVLREFDFPTVMVLPQQGVATIAGVESGVRRFVEALGKPVVLYLKFDGYLDVPSVKRLFDQGLVSVIKYAVVRGKSELSRLEEAIEAERWQLRTLEADWAYLTRPDRLRRQAAKLDMRPATVARIVEPEQIGRMRQLELARTVRPAPLPSGEKVELRLKPVATVELGGDGDGRGGLH